METVANATLVPKMVAIDEDQVRSHLDQVVRESVEQSLNTLLDAEADRICQAGRYRHSAERVDTRAGSYTRSLDTTASRVHLKVPRLRTLPLEMSPTELWSQLLPNSGCKELAQREARFPNWEEFWRRDARRSAAALQRASQDSRSAAPVLPGASQGCLRL